MSPELQFSDGGPTARKLLREVLARSGFDPAQPGSAERALAKLFDALANVWTDLPNTSTAHDPEDTAPGAFRDAAIRSLRASWPQGSDAPGRLLEGKAETTSNKTVENDLRKALQQSEERLSLAIESTDLGMFDFQPRTGTLVLSDIAKRHFGWPADAAVTYETFLRGLHPNDRERVIQVARKALRPEDGGRFEAEYRTIGLADGKERWMSAWGRVLFDAEGRAIRFIGVTQDVTERKRIQEQLQHSQKLETIGVLAGGIAHDFNNLLTAILGNASLALFDAPPSIRRPLEGIIESGQSAAGITRQLLAYAGKGRFQTGDFDVAQLIRSSTDLIRISIPKNIELEMDVPPQLPLVRGDSTQIHQVVMNLVINAAEAIGDSSGGKVRVSAGPMDAPEGILGRDLSPGSYVRITVQDNGCGMDEATLSKIFDPFFTTKFTGRGLGLAAVQGILRSHDAKITVESTPGHGTKFEVYLPSAARRGARPAAGERAAPWRRGGTVLVVEDEQQVRNFVKAALERAGHEVVVAQNGREALDVLSSGRKLDVVLLDIVMPVLGGAEAFLEIRKQRPGIAIVVTSGYSREEAQRLGIPEDLPFVAKPYTADKLAAAIQKAIEGLTGN